MTVSAANGSATFVTLAPGIPLPEGPVFPGCPTIPGSPWKRKQNTKTRQSNKVTKLLPWSKVWRWHLSYKMYLHTFAPIGPTGPTEPGWPLDPLSPLSPCQSNTTLLLIWNTIYEFKPHINDENCPLPSLQVSLYQEHRQVPWALATQCHPAVMSKQQTGKKHQFIKRKQVWIRCYLLPGGSIFSWLTWYTR